MSREMVQETQDGETRPRVLSHRSSPYTAHETFEREI